MVPALESGFFQREIGEAAYIYQREEDRKERITVGVNDYVTDEALTIPLLRVDREGEARQIDNLNPGAADAGQPGGGPAVEGFGDGSQGTDNLMPPLLEAVRAYATLGEMMGVFREVFGSTNRGGGFRGRVPTAWWYNSRRVPTLSQAVKDGKG